MLQKQRHSRSRENSSSSGNRRQSKKISVNDVLLLGITGGIGCGQSTVANFFAAEGAKVIDADKIAKEIIAKNTEARKQIQKAFGKGVLLPNKRIDRRKLAREAFLTKQRTARLNRIVHPLMVERIIDLMERARDRGKYPIVAVDAALIYEIQLETIFDAILVVSSRKKTRIERVKQRDKLTEEEIKQRIMQQIPIQEKTGWADFVIQNNGDLEQLEKLCKKRYAQILAYQKSKEWRKKR